MEKQLGPRARDAGAEGVTDLAGVRVVVPENSVPNESSKGEQAQSPDFVTVLTAKRLLLTKRILRGQDGRPVIRDYDNAKHFDITSVAVTGLDDLARVLDDLGPHSCIVRGRLVAGVDPENARRRIYPDPQTGEPATLEAAAHNWIPIDLDAIDCPAGLDPVVDPERAIDHVVNTVLPPEMRDADVYWQLTSGAGFKPGIRLRLVFVSDRPMTDAELKRWLANRDGVDAAIYTANQPIYFAKPQFEGIADPVPRRSGIRRGSRRLVAPPATLNEAPRNVAVGSVGLPGIGYEGFCARIGDHAEGEGFFEPIKSAVASWIAAGGDPEELRHDIEQRIRAAPRDPLVHPDSYIAERVRDLDSLIRWVETQQGQRPVVSKSDHRGRARQFRGQERPNLQRWRGEFFDWDGARYRQVADETIESEVGGFLENSIARDDEGKLRPFLPNRTTVGETIFALRGVSHLRPETNFPAWLDGRAGPPPADLISFPNGLLNWRTGEFLPPTPALFSHGACGFEYDPDAAPPDRFLRFLDEVFDREEEQIETLQEIFGYCLTPDVSQQKMFLIVGPKRSGKGTIAGVLRALLADGAACGPTIASFAGNFGLQPLIGRQLAIVDDLRIGRRTDKALLAERLLTISGGGELTIDRKNRDAWTGPLAIKFLIISNEVPAFADDSGALASRFIGLSTRTSFYEREDRFLLDKLAVEKAGIFQWALEGLRRLEERGRFDEPGSSKEIRHRLAAAASPVQAFIEERCTFDPAASVKKDDLFRAYVTWAERSKQPLLDKNIFAEALLSAGDGRVKPAKRRIDGRQVPHFVGIHLARDDLAERIL